MAGFAQTTIVQAAQTVAETDFIVQLAEETDTKSALLSSALPFRRMKE
jgi:hypothetical protein